MTVISSLFLNLGKFNDVGMIYMDYLLYSVRLYLFQK